MKTIYPIKTKNHKLYFSSDDFAFLKDPSIEVTSMVLEGSLKDCRNQEEPFQISINGNKMFRKDGHKHLELVGNPIYTDQHHKMFDSKFKCDLHSFFIKGGIPLHTILLKIKEHKGFIILDVGGGHRHILDARIVVIGRQYPYPCPNPQPSPGPTPQPNPAPSPNPEPQPTPNPTPLPVPTPTPVPQPTPEPTPTPTPQPVPTAPVTSIDSAMPNMSPTNSTTEVFTFSADQSGVGFSCSLDSAAYSVCSSPIVYSGLGNGSHTFKVYATNAAGLSDVHPAIYSWIVDAAPPIVTIDNLLSLQELTSSSSITFEFSSSKPNSYFRCVLDGGSLRTCSSPYSYTSLSEGVHSFAVYVTDGFGIPGQNPATFSWTVDMTAPIASFTSIIPSDAISNSKSRSFQFSANESATFKCSVDGMAFANCSSPVSLSNLTEGNHSFAVQPSDPAGNVGATINDSWVTDLTPPVLSFTNILPVPGLTNSGNINVEFTASEPSTFYCIFDSSPAVNCTSPFINMVFTEGAHSLTVYARDYAGNLSQNGFVNWQMDFTIPVISFGSMTPSAAAFINSSNFSAEIISSEALTFSSILNGISLGQNSSPISLSGLSEGDYILEVSGQDVTGNASNTITHTFTVDLTAPILSVSSEASGVTPLDSNTVTFSTNEISTFECDVDLMGFGACASPLNLSGLADGPHQVRVRATDRAGNVSAIGGVTWTVRSLLRTFIISTDPNEPVTNRITMSIEFGSNYPDATFKCGLNGELPSPCTTPMSFSNLDDGTYVFFVQAVDSQGNVDTVGATYTWTVDSRGPVVTSQSFSVTNNSITINWTTSKGATGKLSWGTGALLDQMIPDDGSLNLNHSITLSDLTANTLYSLQVGGVDQAHNPYVGNLIQVRTNR